jgi:hypothetical protein
VVVSLLTRSMQTYLLAEKRFLATHEKKNKPKIIGSRLRVATLGSSNVVLGL